MAHCRAERLIADRGPFGNAVSPGQFRNAIAPAVVDALTVERDPTGRGDEVDPAEA
jgi:hypothetical protein